MIIDEECTEAEGGVYHIKCFACTSCRRPLGGLQYIMHPVSDASDIREPYCTDCFDSLFGEYCEGCGQLIHVAKGAAITHEGRSWHANECCFKCQNCQQSLLGLPFLPHSSGFIFCSVNCSKDAFNPRLRQSNNQHQQQLLQQQQHQQQMNHSSDTGTSATSTPSCISRNNEDHVMESLDCKSGSEMRDSVSISQLTRIQDEVTPPPLPSLSPSSGCSSSNSIQANSLNDSNCKNDDHHHQQQEQLHHHRPVLESGSLKQQTPPPVFQTSSPSLSARAEREYSATSRPAPAQGPDQALYSSLSAKKTEDGDQDEVSKREIILLHPVHQQEDGVIPEDSASSSYYACIGSLFNQAVVLPHQSVQIPVNPHSASSFTAIVHSEDQLADSRKMIAIHAQQNQGVVSHQIRDRDGHQILAEEIPPATQSPPSPVPSLPPKSPTICLLNGTSYETPAEGQVNPAFKTDEADSSESNNNKNDLIEELESIRIVDQSSSKSEYQEIEHRYKIHFPCQNSGQIGAFADHFFRLLFPFYPFDSVVDHDDHHNSAPKTVSFDETMKEKESSSSSARRLRRRRRGKRKHHHNHHSRRRRDHRHHRNHRSSSKSKSNSEDEEEDEEESDCCSCSSCCSESSSCSDSSCSTCSSSSSSDEDDDGAGDSFDLQWTSNRMPVSSEGIGSEASVAGASGHKSRKQGRVSSVSHHQQQFLTSSNTATGSLTRPPLPLRPDIKRQPNTACLIQ
jgi:hypothetical protein